ncbi:MAG: hypothetical protein PHU64_00815 [Candidatus Omnitrophica bacterium]|nr:hypothetical protein [Candidatus Omnitrophota bacterium]MDD5430339.1 hypothetical protein [Candidatus Omnitrophota bacterium]
MEKIIFKIFLIAVSLLGFTSFALAQSPSQEESVTLTTYYPAPYGVYKDLEAKDGLVVGDISTGTGASSVGDLHQGELWVGKGLILNPQDSGPADGKTGELIYDESDKILNFFDGSAWVAVGASSGAGCFVYYCNNVGANVCTNKAASGEPDDFCPVGFDQKSSVGSWGYCGEVGSSPGGLCNYAYSCPPGAGCVGGTALYRSVGQAYFCCKK